MTDTDIKPEAAPRRSRWLFPALVASLALNLLFVGGVVGAKVMHKRYGGPHGADFGLMGFVRELPDERRKLIRDEIKKAREAMKPMRATVRDAWGEANAVLTVEPFDKQKFKAAMAKLSDAEVQFKTAVSNSLADTAEKLTPEERKQLQAWREKRRPGFFGKGPKGPPDGPPGE